MCVAVVEDWYWDSDGVVLDCYSVEESAGDGSGGW